jgi:hypothetical protein
MSAAAPTTVSEVGVVVDFDPHLQPLGQPARRLDPDPPRQDGLGDHAPGGAVHGSGYRDSGTDQALPIHAGLADQAADKFGCRVQARLRVVVHVPLDRALGQDGQRQVSDRDPNKLMPELDADHGPGAGVE